MSERVTLGLRIRGVVQGVWYRESMRGAAESAGVNGWVRNLPDGSVEAVVQGHAAAVDALVAWARRGPEKARVDSVETSPADGHFAAFEVRR